MKKIGLLLALCLLLTGCGKQAEPAPTLPAEGTLQVHFLRESTLLEWEGTYLLMGSLSEDAVPAVEEFLRQKNVERLEAVVCTGSADPPKELLERFPAEMVYGPEGTSGTVLGDGDWLTFGSTVITALCPGGDGEPMLRLVFGDHSFLLADGLTEEKEKALLDRATDLRATVLRLDGAYLPGEAFLEAAAPGYVVIPEREEALMARLGERMVCVLDGADAVMVESDGVFLTLYQSVHVSDSVASSVA